MRQQKTVCNRENKSRSDLFDRKCWIADSVLSLVQSRAEYLFQRDASKFSNADTDPDSPLWALLADLDYYIEELRVKNGLREPSVLNRDEKWPESLELATTPSAPSEPGAARERGELQALCDRQSDILSRVAVALRGPEPPLMTYGWADLPERAKSTVQERDEARHLHQVMAKSHEAVCAELCEVDAKLADLRTRIETKCKEIEARMQHCGSVEFNPDDILEISREFRALLTETEAK